MSLEELCHSQMGVDIGCMIPQASPARARATRYPKYREQNEADGVAAGGRPRWPVERGSKGGVRERSGNLYTHGQPCQRVHHFGTALRYSQRHAAHSI